jgi:hypothetical protein
MRQEKGLAWLWSWSFDPYLTRRGPGNEMKIVIDMPGGKAFS